MSFLSRQNVDICYNKISLSLSLSLSHFSKNFALFDNGDFCAVAILSAKCPLKTKLDSKCVI